MSSQPKLTIRNTPLPFVPKSAFRKKLDRALSLAKDHIEHRDISEELYAEAQKLRRTCAFSIPSNSKGGLGSWEDAHLLDLLAIVWDPSFLATISQEDNPRQLRERAKQSMITAGYLSAIEIPDSRTGIWTESELRQFSNASKLIAQAEIFMELARVREETVPKIYTKK